MGRKTGLITTETCLCTSRHYSRCQPADFGPGLHVQRFRTEPMFLRVKDVRRIATRSLQLPLSHQRRRLRGVLAVSELEPWRTLRWLAYIVPNSSVCDRFRISTSAGTKPARIHDDKIAQDIQIFHI